MALGAVCAVALSELPPRPGTLPTSAYTHDANGQPAGDGVQAYQWNARHELIRVQCVNDALAWFVAPRTAWER